MFCPVARLALLITRLNRCADQWTGSLDVNEYVDLLAFLHDSVKAQLEGNGYFAKRKPPVVAPTDPPPAPPVVMDAVESKAPPPEPLKVVKPARVPLVIEVPQQVEAPTTKGLPAHTCKVRSRPLTSDDPTMYCQCCRRIAEWNRQRRELLSSLEGSGKKPWIGAWAVRPDSYRIDLDEDNIEDLLPVTWPGDGEWANSPGRAVWRCPGPVSPDISLPYEYMEGTLYDSRRDSNGAAADGIDRAARDAHWNGDGGGQGLTGWSINDRPMWRSPGVGGFPAYMAEHRTEYAGVPGGEVRVMSVTSTWGCSDSELRGKYSVCG